MEPEKLWGLSSEILLGIRQICSPTNASGLPRSQRSLSIQGPCATHTLKPRRPDSPVNLPWPTKVIHPPRLFQIPGGSLSHWSFLVLRKRPRPFLQGKWTIYAGGLDSSSAFLSPLHLHTLPPCQLFLFLPPKYWIYNVLPSLDSFHGVSSSNTDTALSQVTSEWHLCCSIHFSVHLVALSEAFDNSFFL